MPATTSPTEPAIVQAGEEGERLLQIPVTHAGPPAAWESEREELLASHRKDKDFAEAAQRRMQGEIVTLQENYDQRLVEAQLEIQDYYGQLVALRKDLESTHKRYGAIDIERDRQLRLRDDKIAQLTHALHTLEKEYVFHLNSTLAQCRNQIVEMKTYIRRIQRNVGYRLVRGINNAFRAITGKKKLEKPKFDVPCFGHLKSHFPDDFKISQTALISGDPLYRQEPLGEAIRTYIDRLKRDFRNVLYLCPSRQNYDLHIHLCRSNITQHCLQENKEWLQRDLVHAVCHEKPLELILVDDYHLFSTADLIVIDLPADQHRLNALKGRLLPHQRLLIYGPASVLTPIVTTTPPHTKGEGFIFFYAPPMAWLSPSWSFLPRPDGAHFIWKTARPKPADTMPSGNPWPRITVVTPAYQHGHFIEDTIRSVLDQNYPNLEYLVLDGGSTDNTREILDKYRSRLTYAVSEKDNGQADAINKGFQRGTGDIMCWINSDDRLAPDSLRRVALTFEAFPDADLLSGSCALVMGRETTPFKVQRARLHYAQTVPLPLERLLNLDECWFLGDFFYQPEVFWRRRIWQAVGETLTAEYYYSFDYELWVRMAIAGAKIVRISDTLATYRVHEAQKTYGENVPYMPEMRKINAEMREKASALNTASSAHLV